MSPPCAEQVKNYYSLLAIKKAMAKRTSLQRMEYAVLTNNYILVNGDLTISPCYNTFAHQLVACHEQLKFQVAAWAVHIQIVHVAVDNAINVT